MPIPPPISPPNNGTKFAGYNVTPLITDTLTKVTSTFIVPDAQTFLTTELGIWVGIVFNTSNYDIPYFPQLGVAAVTAGTKVDWYAWTAQNFGPDYVPIVVKPGDIITVSVEYFSIAQNCLMSMTNVTTGISFSRYAIPDPVNGTIISYIATFSIEAVVDGAFVGPPTLAYFSPIEYTNCIVRISGVDYTISSHPTALVQGYSIGWTAENPTTSVAITSQLADGGSTFYVTSPFFVAPPPPPGAPTDVIVISGYRESDFNSGIMS